MRRGAPVYFREKKTEPPRSAQCEKTPKMTTLIVMKSPRRGASHRTIAASLGPKPPEMYSRALRNTFRNFLFLFAKLVPILRLPRRLDDASAWANCARRASQRIGPLPNPPSRLSFQGNGPEPFFAAADVQNPSFFCRVFQDTCRFKPLSARPWQQPERESQPIPRHCCCCSCCCGGVGGGS